MSVEVVFFCSSSGSFGTFYESFMTKQFSSILCKEVIWLVPWVLLFFSLGFGFGCTTVGFDSITLDGSILKSEVGIERITWGLIGLSHSSSLGNWIGFMGENSML